MRNLYACGLLVLGTVACSDTANVGDVTYGKGQPGVALPEGGEIRHENVRAAGTLQTWLMVYQYTGPTVAMKAPFADATIKAQTGDGMFAPCVDERNGEPTWPFTPITGATYLTLPQVKISGPGFATPTAIPLTADPANRVGNSTFRSYGGASGITYGGGTPGAPPAGYNGTLVAAEAQPDSDYTIDIGKKGMDASKGTAMTYHMPPAFTTPLNIGMAGAHNDPVVIPAGKDLEYTWDAPANDFGPDGNTHTTKTWFNFTLFADPSSPTNPPLFICFPDVIGQPDKPHQLHQRIPKAVIDLLPAGGLMVNADLSHYMEAREASPGEFRRFDLVTIYCNISPFMKQ